MKISRGQLSLLIKIFLISLIPVLVVYLPFIFHLSNVWGIPLKTSGMQQIFANWDGPNYVLNAITLYDPVEIAKRAFINRPNEYYAAHFPAFSILIRLFSPIGGYFGGAILVQLISGIAVNVIFFYWIKDRVKNPLWLTFVFTIFPPRYWIMRAVIAPEFALMACVIAILYFWHKEKWIWCGIISLIAVLFKFQIIVFTPVFAVLLIEKIIKKQKISWQQIILPIFPIIGYGLVSFIFFLTYNNWNAFFVGQSSVGMGMSLPFYMFNYSQKWVSTGWMEAPALYFVAMMLLIAKLWQGRDRIAFWFALGYTLMLTLIPQVDIMRLAMPLAPLFVLTFHEALSNKYFRLGLIFSIPFLYLFTINFIMSNQAPIADWSLFR